MASEDTTVENTSEDSTSEQMTTDSTVDNTIEDTEDTTIYKVVVNHEEQYSIWPEYRDNPLGWRSAGKVGPKADCLEYIKTVWTDMRPLSLRKKMAEAERSDSPST